MQIPCPYCQKTVEVPGGGQFTCPHCRAVFAVDLEPPASPAPPPPTPATGPTAPFPGTAAPPPPSPAGAPACAKHPLRPAADVCRRCGNFTCALCVIPVGAERYCPDCVDKIGMGGGGSTPWESERLQLGTFGAWWKTTKEALFEPDAFFQKMAPEGGMNGPLTYYLLGGTIFGAIGQVFLSLIMVGLASMGPGGSRAMGEAMVQLVCNVVALPIGLLFVAVIGAAMYHLAVLVLGGTRGYETTFRVYSYAAGATAICGLVPGIGALVGAIWALVLMYHGFRHAQKMENGRALLAACSMLILALCCCGLLFGAGFMSAMSRQGGF